MEKISPIKERILSFIDNQRITKQSFCEKTDISYANLKGRGLFSEIGGQQIGKILSSYPEISPEWLLTGKGEMLRGGADKSSSMDNSSVRIAELEERIAEQKERIAEQKERIADLKDHIDDLKKEKDAALVAACAGANKQRLA